jgi:putative transposase
MTAYIDAHKGEYGVEPICRVLEMAPSTYYAATTRRPTARDTYDQHLKQAVEFVWVRNRGVYGVEKVWEKLRQEGVPVARCTLRQMRALGIRGAMRGKTVRTTFPDLEADRPEDLVDRGLRRRGTDGLGAPKFTISTLQRMWESDRSDLAENVLADLSRTVARTRCSSRPTVSRST